MSGDVLDSIAGCLLGGAIGDAWGGPYEGRTPPFPVSLDHDWELSDDVRRGVAARRRRRAGRRRGTS